MDFGQLNQSPQQTKSAYFHSNIAEYGAYLTKVNRKKMSKIEQIYIGKNQKDYALKVPSFSCWQNLYFQIIMMALATISNGKNIYFCPGIFVKSKNNSPQIFYFQQQEKQSQLTANKYWMQQALFNSKFLELADKIESQVEKMTLDAVLYYETSKRVKQNQKQYFYRYQIRIIKVSKFIRQQILNSQNKVIENQIFIRKVQSFFNCEQFSNNMMFHSWNLKQWPSNRKCEKENIQNTKLIQRFRKLVQAKNESPKSKTEFRKKRRKIEYCLISILEVIKQLYITDLIICSEPGNQIKIDQYFQKDELSYQEEQQNMQTIRAYFRVNQVIYCISVQLQKQRAQVQISYDLQSPQMFQIKVIFLTNISQKLHQKFIGVLVSNQIWEESPFHKYFFQLQKRIKFSSQNLQKRVFNYRKSLLMMSSQNIPQSKLLLQIQKIISQITYVYYRLNPLIEQLSYLQNLKILFKSSVQKRQQIYETRKSLNQSDVESNTKLDQIESLYDQTNQIKIMFMQLMIFNSCQSEKLQSI